MRHLLDNLGNPRGLIGRLVLRKMAKAHGPLLHWTLDEIDLGGVRSILDVGCGRGESLRVIGMSNTHVTLTGLDISSTSVASARRNCRSLVAQGRCHIVEGGVDSLPFDDGLFDIVLAIETYFFWPDLHNGLCEIHRVLAPGGRFILASEAYDHPDFRERNRIWEEKCGIRFLSPDDIEAEITAAGFGTEIRLEEDNNWIVAVGTKH